MSAQKKKPAAKGGPKSSGPGSSESPKGGARERYRLPREGGWANAWKVSGVLAGVGILGCAMGYGSDPHRFAFSWLFAFMTFLAFALGGLFLVIIQHMAGAGWGVVVRRTSEFYALPLVGMILLAIPFLAMTEELYPWVHHAREAAHEAAHEEHHEGAAHEAEGEEHSSLLVGVARAQEHGAAEGHGGGHAEGGHDAHHTPEHAMHESVIEAKLAFLNEPFFWARAVVYFGIWFLIALFFFRSSTRQDTTRDVELTKSMQWWSPLATMAFAVTTTFAAIDWVMSLEPAWFSTIFGVQYFSVSVVAGLASAIVTLYSLKNAGHLGEAVTVEHFHDMGKLLFGFLVFWAYITFSQFMLIWYASIPEETTYYHMRWEGGWEHFSIALLVCHFIVPFFLLMSRNVKRRLPVLAFGAGWILVMHILQVFWLVMPYASPGALTFHWLDICALLAVGGVYLTAVFWAMGQFPLIPVGDPRLSRSMHLEVH